METYKALNKTYAVIPTPKDLSCCEQCCFSQEDCFKIIDIKGFMACGCEFGGRFHCKLV